MPSTTHILQTLDDRMNPIVVKELRQWVTGHALSTMLILFLLAQLIILGVLSFHDFFADRAQTGRQALTALFWSSFVISGLIVPSHTQGRMKKELKDDQADLMIVAVGGEKYLRGKVMATLLFSAMIYASAAPFAAITVLMRGVDPPTVLLLAAVNGFAIVALAVFEIISACMLRRALTGVLIAFMTFPGTIITFLGARAFLSETMEHGPGWLAGSEIIAGVASVCMAIGCMAGIGYLVAAASLDPITGGTHANSQRPRFAAAHYAARPPYS